jgi:hypothetical protein
MSYATITAEGNFDVEIEVGEDDVLRALGCYSMSDLSDMVFEGRDIEDIRVDALSDGLQKMEADVAELKSLMYSHSGLMQAITEAAGLIVASTAPVEPNTPPTRIDKCVQLMEHLSDSEQQSCYEMLLETTKKNGRYIEPTASEERDQ